MTVSEGVCVCGTEDDVRSAGDSSSGRCCYATVWPRGVSVVRNAERTIAGRASLKVLRTGTTSQTPLRRAQQQQNNNNNNNNRGGCV